MKKTILFCLVSSSLLGGCSSFSSDEVTKSPVPTYQPSDVSEQIVYDALMEAAQNADRSLQVLTEVNNAAKQDALTYEKIRQANWRVNYVPTGLERRETLNWNGPIRPLLSQLAKNGQYNIRFIGELPPVPTTVNIVAKDTPIIDILRDVAAKTDGLLDINIYDHNNNNKLGKDAKLIEVKYVDGFK